MIFSIVPITEEHIDGFHKTLDSVARERRYIGFFEAPPIDSTRAFVQKNLEKQIPQFVAVAGEKVIGWCDIMPKDRLMYAHCGILGVGVLRDYRGQGIGKALIQKTIEKALHTGLTRIELSVREDNINALELYKKLGFIVEGLQRNAIRIDGAYENLVTMAIILDE